MEIRGSRHLVFALLISDYMARQVLSAVYPLLKQQWNLSDTRLGLLSGVVAMTVAVLTLPLSLLADRLGRIRSITVMAMLWSLATLLCAIAQSYSQMLAARVLVGVGEAAYGGVGLALLLSIFPARLRGTISATFLAGGLLGQVLGVGLGGLVAAAWGWRIAFAAMGLFGLAIALIFPMVVRPTRVVATSVAMGLQAVGGPPPGFGSFRQLLRGKALLCTYLAGGLQFFMVGALPAWLPSYFVRYHGLAIEQASGLAAGYLLACGVGMIGCGALSDRLAGDGVRRRLQLAAAYSLICALCLGIAFQLAVGPAQLALLGIAMFFAAGTVGPCSAIVATLTPANLSATALAIMALAISLFGLAPGPVFTGRLADSIGLLGAFQLLPVVGAVTTAIFVIAVFTQDDKSTSREIGPV
jgi:MFS family permease